MTPKQVARQGTPLNREAGRATLICIVKLVLWLPIRFTRPQRARSLLVAVRIHAPLEGAIRTLSRSARATKDRAL